MDVTRGRKPKADAQRRGGLVPRIQEAVAVDASPVEKPPHIAANPTMSACWDMLFAHTSHHAPEDVPLMDAYCYWYSVYLQACNQTITPDGRVVTLYGEKKQDGTTNPATVRVNPDINPAKKATEMMMRLASVLEISPESRARAGLVSALTKSTQADVVSKTIASYTHMKRLQDAQEQE